MCTIHVKIHVKNTCFNIKNKMKSLMYFELLFQNFFPVKNFRHFLYEKKKTLMKMLYNFVASPVA